MMRGILLSCLLASTLAYGQQAAVDVPSTCVTSPHPQENPQARQIFINKFKQLGFPGTPSDNQIRCVMNTPPDGRIAKIQEIITEVKSSQDGGGRIGTAVTTTVAEPKILGTFQNNDNFMAKNAPGSGNVFMPLNNQLSKIVWKSSKPECTGYPQGIMLPDTNADRATQKNYQITCTDPEGCQAVLNDPSVDCLSRLKGNFTITLGDAPPTPLAPLPMMKPTEHNMIAYHDSDSGDLMVYHKRNAPGSDLPDVLKLSYTKFTPDQVGPVKSFLTTTAPRLEIKVVCKKSPGCQLLCNNSPANTGACSKAPGKINFLSLNEGDYALLPPDNLNILGELTSFGGVIVEVTREAIIDNGNRFVFDEQKRGYKIPQANYDKLVQYFKDTGIGSQQLSLKLECTDTNKDVCRVKFLGQSNTGLTQYYEISGGALNIIPIKP